MRNHIVNSNIYAYKLYDLNGNSNTTPRYLDKYLNQFE